jgi:hypothetical protein
MFIILATKALNDRTKGFRFNVLGLKGLTRKRKYKSRGWGIKHDKCMTAVHMGKRTVYFERKVNVARKLHHFAG